MSALVIDHKYRYLHASRLSLQPAGSHLRLATSSLHDTHPYFFEGRLTRPKLVAALLRALMSVVQARYHMPPAMMARVALSDPVVTSGHERLRFEGFSACCGVYVRVDLLPQVIDGERLGRGTTNVDFNPPMLGALANIRDSDHVRLSVGHDALQLHHNTQPVVEKRVRLPLRWLRGLSEVQAAQSRMTASIDVPGIEARRFLRSLPRGGTRRSATWVVPAGRGLRLAHRESPEGVPVCGVQRLRVLEHLVHSADRLRVYRDDATGASSWELSFLDQARFHLVISPEPWRGFSGEGQLLSALVDDERERVLPLLHKHLEHHSVLDTELLVQQYNVEPAAVRGGLAVLASRGLLGYDLTDDCYFHRELPFDLTQVEKLQPRLRKARKLLDGGKVPGERCGTSSALAAGRVALHVPVVCQAWGDARPLQTYSRRRTLAAGRRASWYASRVDGHASPQLISQPLPFRPRLISSMNVDQLKSILQQGDKEACIEFFAGRTAKERSSVAKLCADWLREVRSKPHQLNGRWNDDEFPLLPAAAVAATAACSCSDLLKFGWEGRPAPQDVVRVLRDRRPSWCDRYVEAMLTEEWYWTAWPLVRQLVREGICPKPTHPHYILGMVGGLGAADSPPALADRLREDPELLDDEIWQLFEIEGAGENSLANRDRWSQNRPWTGAFCRLAASGDLPRDRLLDATLEALQRDFNQYQSRWYAGLHDALKPTDKERHARRQRYLALLEANTATTVSWAFAVAEALDKQQPFTSDELAEALRPVLRSRQKGIVKKALRLLERMVKREPAAATVAARTATEALLHEAVDVQEAALKLLEKHGDKADAGLCEQIAARTDAVAPSLQNRVQAWSGNSQPQPREAASPPIETHTERRIPKPLDPQRQLAPIQNLDELFDVCARVLEEPTLVDEAERAIDGISRLCDQRPEDFERRIGPVLKRAVQKLHSFSVPFAGLGPENDVCGLVIVWGRSEMVELEEVKGRKDVIAVTDGGESIWGSSNQLHRALGFISRRSRAVAERVLAGNARPLLSAPTHRGGQIDPAQFVKRANQWTADGAQPDLHDTCLALLRLADERRKDALAELTEGNVEWLQAARHALQANGVKPGPTAALWICAARARAAREDDPVVERRHKELGPDAGKAAEYKVQVDLDRKDWENLQIVSRPELPAEVDADHLPVLLHLRPTDDWFHFPALGGESPSSVQWAATIWPSNLEPYCAAGACELLANIDWREAKWHNKHYLQPLLDSHRPLGEMAALAVAVALAAKEPGEHGLATDVAIAGVADGRLDAERLGAAMSELLPTGRIKAARWAKTLGDVARGSPQHASAVHRAIECSLRGDISPAPRDLQAMLSLFHELSVETSTPVQDPDCRRYLESIRGSGKAAKAARQLLALS